MIPCVFTVQARHEKYWNVCTSKWFSDSGEFVARSKLVACQDSTGNDPPRISWFLGCLGLQNPAFAAYVQQGQQGKGMGAPNPAALTMPGAQDGTNHIRCVAYLYLSIPIPIITYYICTYIWSRVSCSHPTYAYTIIYTYIPPDVLPRMRFGICSESSFAYIYILVHFCTYTCYIRIHAHVSTVYIYIYTCYIYIYIHYLHIHIHITYIYI